MHKILSILLASCLISAPALGAKLKGGSVYGGVHGGAAFLMDADNEDDDSAFSVKSEADTGFAVGGFAGYRFNNGVRLEGEGTYRRNSLDTLSVTNDAGLGNALGIGSLNGLTLEADGDVSSFVFMANVWFEPEVGEGLLPYIGGGLGAAHVMADASALGTTLVDDSDTVFAGQVGAGIGYAVLPNLVLSGDYRFLMTTDPTLTDESGAEFDSEYMVHSIMFSVRGHF